MWTITGLKTSAKEVLQRNFWSSVVVSIIFSIVSGSGGSAVGYTGGMSGSFGNFSSELTDDEKLMIFLLLGIVILAIMLCVMLFDAFVFCPIRVGCQRFFLRCRDGRGIVDDAVFVFRDHYFNVVKTMFIRAMKIMLWTLLFIIPGIIKAYEYFLVQYILADDPSADPEKAHEMSREMMDGNKFRLFLLGLSFIGWAVLNIFTFGLLALFWLNPYINLTYAEFYHTLRDEYDRNHPELTSAL